MRRLSVVAIGLIALGVVLLAYTIYTGQASGYIFVVIPVFASSSPYALAGMLSLFAGIFLLFYSVASPITLEQPGARPSKAPQAGASATAPPTGGKKFGGVVFLGPIPIVFGSDKKVAKWMLLLAIVLVILLIIAFLFFALK